MTKMIPLTTELMDEMRASVTVTPLARLPHVTAPDGFTHRVSCRRWEGDGWTLKQHCGWAATGGRTDLDWTPVRPPFGMDDQDWRTWTGDLATEVHNALAVP